MKTPPFVSVAVAVALVACGGEAPPPSVAPEPTVVPAPPPRMCTEMGCDDGATVVAEVLPADAVVGTHTFAVQAGGEEQTCTLEVTQVGERTTATCTGTASLTLGPVMRQTTDTTTVPGVAMMGEEAVPNRFEWRLSLDGTPADVHVVRTIGDRQVDDRRDAFDYADVRPNGEGCEPVCRQATLHWEIRSMAPLPSSLGPLGERAGS